MGAIHSNNQIIPIQANQSSTYSSVDSQASPVEEISAEIKVREVGKEALKDQAAISSTIGSVRSLSPLSNKALKIIQSKPMGTFTDSLLKETVNFGLKGIVISEEEKEEFKKLHETYDGLKVHGHANVRAESACRLLKESETAIPLNEEEREGLMRIAQHRNRMLDYSNQIRSVKRILPFSPVIKEIMANIEELDHPVEDPALSKVVVLKDGTVTFSLPGGDSSHYMTYEVQKKGSDYFFILHNRGEKCDDARLHALANFEVGGKIYRKTSVRIHVSKDILKNPDFFAKLLDANTKKANQAIYDLIHSTLIVGGKGQIMTSEKEKVLEKLYFLSLAPITTPEMKKAIQQMAAKLIEQCEDFHSEQLYGSCVESNATAPEKHMAPPSLQRLLKHYTLNSLVEALKTEILSTPQPDAKTIIKYADIKIKALDQKIDQPKVSGELGLEDLDVTMNEMEEDILSMLKQSQIDMAKAAYHHVLMPMFQVAYDQLHDIKLGEEIKFEDINKALIKCKWFLLGLEKRNDRELLAEIKQDLLKKIALLENLFALAKQENRDEVTTKIEEMMQQAKQMWLPMILSKKVRDDSLFVSNIGRDCAKILNELKQKKEKGESIGFFVQRVLNTCDALIEQCQEDTAPTDSSQKAKAYFEELRSSLDQLKSV